jgi:hypothetical protein
MDTINMIGVPPVAVASSTMAISLFLSLSFPPPSTRKARWMWPPFSRSAINLALEEGLARLPPPPDSRQVEDILGEAHNLVVGGAWRSERTRWWSG